MQRLRWLLCQRTHTHQLAVDTTRCVGRRPDLSDSLALTLACGAVRTRPCSARRNASTKTSEQRHVHGSGFTAGPGLSSAARVENGSSSYRDTQCHTPAHHAGQAGQAPRMEPRNSCGEVLTVVVDGSISGTRTVGRGIHLRSYSPPTQPRMHCQLPQRTPFFNCGFKSSCNAV